MNSNNFNFTPMTVESLSTKDGDKIGTFFDTNPKGSIPNCKLMLQVGAKSKTYYLVFRKNVNGRANKKLVKLGQHPTMTVTLARESFLENAMVIVSDQDKFLTKKKNDGITVADLIEFYDANKGIKESESFMFNTVKKGLGSVQIKNLDRYTVQDFYKPQIKTGNLYSANSRREVIQRVWNYGLANDRRCAFLEDRRNPASFKIDGFKKIPSDRKIERFQIKPLMEAIESETHKDKRDLLKLFFYLGQHPYSEICEMRWDQIKEDKEYPGTFWWNMEEGFHKVKDSKHSVYLHPEVLEIINSKKGLSETHVFVSADKKDSKGNLLPYGKSSFTKQMKRIKNAIDDQNIDIRCFRATVTTHLREMNKGYEPSYLLGQALTGISQRVYTRSEFKPHKIDMTDAWMDFIKVQIND